MIFIDSNVLIDILEGSGRWYRWSEEALANTVVVGPRTINAVVLAECAAHFPDIEEELAFVRALDVDVAPIPAAAAYRAGLAHRAYRRAGGERIAVLADFLIGGHAAAIGAPLLTRDRQRFASYFPELTLITPETDSDG